MSPVTSPPWICHQNVCPHFKFFSGLGYFSCCYQELLRLLRVVQSPVKEQSRMEAGNSLSGVMNSNSITTNYRLVCVLRDCRYTSVRFAWYGLVESSSSRTHLLAVSWLFSLFLFLYPGLNGGNFNGYQLKMQIRLGSRLWLEQNKICATSAFAQQYKV